METGDVSQPSLLATENEASCVSGLKDTIRSRSEMTWSGHM